MGAIEGRPFYLGIIRLANLATSLAMPSHATHLQAFTL